MFTYFDGTIPAQSTVFTYVKVIGRPIEKPMQVFRFDNTEQAAEFATLCQLHHKDEEMPAYERYFSIDINKRLGIRVYRTITGDFMFSVYPLDLCFGRFDTMAEAKEAAQIWKHYQGGY